MRKSNWKCTSGVRKMFMLTILLCVMSTAGKCDDRGKVMRAWTYTIGQLGLVPIFPPREDVQVGDIYVYPYDPSGDLIKKIFHGDIGDTLGARWGSLPVKEAISSEYRTRHEWPRTPMSSYDYETGDEKLLLTPTDIANMKDFAKSFQAPRTDGSVAASLFPLFSSTTQGYLVAGADLTPQQQMSVLSDVNRVLQNARLWEITPFKALPLSNQNHVLAEANTEGRELLRANRVLLEAAFPTLIQSVLQPHWQPEQPVSAGDGFEIPSITNRLRMVAFPDFVSTSFTGAAVNALIPVEAMTAALGIVAAKNKLMSVKVSAAEEYACSGAEVHELLFGKIETNPLPPKGSFLTLAEPYRNQFHRILYANSKGGKKTPSMWVQVITDVYYARAMDISIMSEDQVGANGSSGTALSAPNSIQTVAALNSSLRQAPQAATPGSSVAFIGASVVNNSTLGVSMRRVWERPIAIGFRGWNIQLELKNNEVRVIKMEPTKNAYYSFSEIQP